MLVVTLWIMCIQCNSFHVCGYRVSVLFRDGCVVGSVFLFDHIFETTELYTTKQRRNDDLFSIGDSSIIVKKAGGRKAICVYICAYQFLVIDFTAAC